MLCVAVSAFLGLVVGAVVPGRAMEAVARNYVKRSIDGAIMHYIVFGHRCCLLFCAAIVTRRMWIKPRTTRGLFLSYVAAVCLLHWIGSGYVLCSVGFLLTVIESMVLLSAYQVVGVSRMDDTAYNFGLCTGTAVKSAFAHDMTLDVVLLSAYVGLVRDICRSPPARDGRAAYKNIYIGDARYRYVGWVSLMRTLADTAVVLLCLCSVGSFFKSVGPGTALFISLCSKLRLRALVTSRFAVIAAAAAAGAAVIFKSVVDPVMGGALEDVAFGLTGCIAINYVLETLAERDVFLGNSACALAILFCIPCSSYVTMYV